MWPVTAGAHICSSPGRCSQKRGEHFQKHGPAPSIPILCLVITFCGAVSAPSLHIRRCGEMRKEMETTPIGSGSESPENIRSDCCHLPKFIRSRFCAAASTQYTRCAHRAMGVAGHRGTENPFMHETRYSIAARCADCHREGALWSSSLQLLFGVLA